MIARYYAEDHNPDGGSLPGVPLRDLEQAEFDALPTWLQASVDALPFYRKTKPPTTKAAPVSAAAPDKES